MFKRILKRITCFTIAATVICSGSQWSVTAFAAKDDMEAVSLVNLMINKEYTVFDESSTSGSRIDQERVNLVLKASQFLGTPYVFGAAYGQTDTFDCSSFTKTVFNSLGIDLPRLSIAQSVAGKYVSKANLVVGDLVFFTTRAKPNEVGHVGIYIGDGHIIHTFGEGGVTISTITLGWWADHYVTARRVL